MLYGLRSALFTGLYVSTVAAMSAPENPFGVFLTGFVVSGISGYAVRNSSE